MSWYVRSLAPGDVHRGVLAHGSVRAACGVTFFPARPSPQTPCELPQPEQVCPGCMAQEGGQVVVIPATCSTHPEAGVISLVVRGLGDGRIELEPHGHNGCALTVDATLLFDDLGEWLG